MSYRMWSQELQNMGTWTTEVGTRATECGHKSYRLWAHGVQNVDTRVPECGHMDYRMWACGLQNVGKRPTECGHMDYRMWAPNLQFLYIESIC
jgi:hypothetical protein